MKFFDLGTAFGVLSMGLVGCSSTEHSLGESAGGAAGRGNVAGETAMGGAAEMAGGSGHADGGSSGKGNAAGDTAAGGAIAGAGAPSSAGASSAGASSGGSGGSAGMEAGCLQSGGTVMTALCCSSGSDFPNSCAVGACGCAPSSSHEIKVCQCPGTSCFDGQRCSHGLGGASGASGASGNGG